MSDNDTDCIKDKDLSPTVAKEKYNGSEANREQLREASKKIDYERSHTGNQWGVGVKDPNERQIAYQSYCDHLAKGRFKESWRYVNEDTGSHWTYKSIDKWMRDANEFAPEKLEVANAEGFAFFEKILLDSCSGVNTKANVASLQMTMRNKYGWDKIDRREVNAPEVLASYEKVMIMLAGKQAETKALESKAIDIPILPSPDQ